MLKIFNVKVYDLVESVIASGNAMRINPIENLSQFDETSEEFQKGIKRMIRLNTASKGEVKCHNHALCGIRVAFDVMYPQYWTPEFQRYNFADIVTSSSKMHKLHKMSLRQSTNKYTSPEVIRIAQEAVDNYNKIVEDKTIDKFGYWDSSTDYDKWIEVEGRDKAVYTALMVMISSCPLGLELFMRVDTNYLELQNIYFQRRHHKLEEDWQEGFCHDFIEKLPYFKELILGQANEQPTA